MFESMPNPLLLDELLVDALSEDDAHQVYLQLLRSPDAERLWRRAVRRRAHVDAVARCVLGRPRLAGLVLRLRRVGRKVTKLPEALVQLTTPGAVFAPSLGEAKDGDVAKPIAVSWGAVVVEPCAVGERRKLIVGGAGAYGVGWQKGDGEGVLTSGVWQMEPGDAPVLLAAMPGKGRTPTEAANAGLPTACVILTDTPERA